ncbi:LutC/YkgG family protein [Algoriphagus sp. PAP.12]|uniref:LutC/YkgG family protein n=1 Tax=Algoriphagus sp. PAP.12 TaxID=2996678 RepID=UPI00227B6FB8|nr:LUD domain-containing protein [Algoriphagus sp. PAP.12]
MSSRDQIIQAIQKVKPDNQTLPEIPEFRVPEDLLATFILSIEGNKGQVVSKEDFSSWLKEKGYSKILSNSDRLEVSNLQILPSDPHELAELELAILDGQWASAENGAIWLDDTQLRLRAIPFITEHLVITIPESNILGNMHQAYDKIGAAHSSFGVFIAGPSKTADIEQSLVIGAHGAKSLTVVIV